MLDVMDAGCKRSLEDRDDTRFHLGRHQAGIGPDDADDWDVDAREDVDGRTEQKDRADQKQHQEQNDKGIRTRERKLHYPHTTPLSVVERWLSSFGCAPPGRARPCRCMLLANITLKVAIMPPMSRCDLRDCRIILKPKSETERAVRTSTILL